MESQRNQVGSADRTMGLRGLLHTASATRLPRLYDYALQRRCDHGRQRHNRGCITLETPQHPRSMSEMAIFHQLSRSPQPILSHQVRSSGLGIVTTMPQSAKGRVCQGTPPMFSAVFRACHYCNVTKTWITPFPFVSGSSALPTIAPAIRCRTVPFIA